MDNSELIARITAFIDAQTDEFSKKDLTTAVSKIYDSLKKKKVDGEVKKRAPSAYNLFMKEEMAKLKENKDMSSTEKFKYVAVLWNEKKEEKKEEDVEVKVEKKTKKTEDTEEVKEKKSKKSKKKEEE